jgi:uncharacterized membrane protein
MNVPAITFPRFLLATLLIAVLTHIFIVQMFPRLIMGRAMSVLSTAVGPNGMAAGKRPDETARMIVMPSPDLLYASCAYDLRKGPWRLSSPVPDTYWSLSLFASNTDNFFVVNNRTVKEKVDVILAGMNEAPLLPDGAILAHSPSHHGIALFRFLVRDEADNERVRAFQLQAECQAQGPSAPIK